MPSVFRRQEQPTLDDLRAMVYTPAEMPALVRAQAKRMREAQGVIWNIPCLDRVMNPGKVGDTLGILGRPSNGKSTLLQYLERTEANRLLLQHRAFPEGDEIVLHVTYEQTVEAADTKFLAGAAFSTTEILRGQRADGKKITDEDLMALVQDRDQLPIWYIGESGSQPRKHARMTIENVYAAVRIMKAEFGVTPTLIGLDYLQLVPSDGTVDGKSGEVRLAMNDSKELGRAVGAMIAMALQAARAADRRTEGLPEKEDCQWASDIEQVLDMLLGIYRPITNKKGKNIKYTDSDGNDIDTPATEEMLLTRWLKNRDNRTGDTFMLYCQPERMRIGEMVSTPQTPAPSGGLSF